MTFEFSVNSLNRISSDALIVFAFQNEKGKVSKVQSSFNDFENLDKELKGSLS
jgi:hypothetical protein